MTKVVINKCHGGFGLSDKAYEKLGEYGIPIRRYIAEVRGEDGLFIFESNNEGQVIFDRELTPRGEDSLTDAFYHNYKNEKQKSRLFSRYWDTWTRKEENRTHPLIVKVVEELGDDANGGFAELKVVEIPDDIEWTIEEYDGREWISEAHRTWS